MIENLTTSDAVTDESHRRKIVVVVSAAVAAVLLSATISTGVLLGTQVPSIAPAGSSAGAHGAETAADRASAVDYAYGNAMLAVAGGNATAFASAHDITSLKSALDDYHAQAQAPGVSVNIATLRDRELALVASAVKSGSALQRPASATDANWAAFTTAVEAMKTEHLRKDSDLVALTRAYVDARNRVLVHSSVSAQPADVPARSTPKR